MFFVAVSHIIMNPCTKKKNCQQDRPICISFMFNRKLSNGKALKPQ